MEFSAELRQYIKSERDRIVRQGIRFDSLGRAISKGTREEAIEKEEAEKKRKRRNNKRWERKNEVLPKMRKYNLVFVDEEETKVRCTLCSKVASKYTNVWGQHFESCIHFTRKPVKVENLSD